MQIGAGSLRTDFAEAWAVAGRVPGWLTRAQGRTLWDAAGRVPAGAVIVEIGSHQGRSTVLLGRSALGTGARVVAIDPFVEGRLFGGAATRARLERNLVDARVDGVVRLVVERSARVRATWTAAPALVYVDGKHDYWTVRDDLRWAELLAPGGSLLLHDAFSSVGVTLAVLAHVLPGSRLRYLGRTGSLAGFVAGAPSAVDRLRIVGELPWFARNVVIKLGLRALRLFGYRRPDPF